MKTRRLVLATAIAVVAWGAAGAASAGADHYGENHPNWICDALYYGYESCYHDGPWGTVDPNDPSGGRYPPGCGPDPDSIYYMECRAEAPPL